MLAHPSLAERAAAPMPAQETARLWAGFHSGREAHWRDQLARAYGGFARILAAKVYAKRVYNEMEFGDYLQYASIGLLEAIDRFEPARGIKFETYAAKRITGAMLSGIERASEIQQQIAARRRAMSQRLESLKDDGEDGAPAGDVFARLAELAVGLAIGFALEDSGMHLDSHAEYADNSYKGVELKQLQARMQALVAALPASQRQVIYGHYLQRQAFDEVAAAMRLSRGRVAQIHKEALGNLRARLASLEEVDLRC